MSKAITGIWARVAAAFACVLLGVAAACCINAGSAHAATAAVYTAAVTPSYANPVSGEIEDAAGSGNVTLAESMVTGCTYPAALVEQDADGNTYVTLRLKLADQIGSVQVWADTAGDGAFLSTDVEKVQTGSVDDTATADYRFLVPGKDSNLRISMDVTPMGREVIYFASLSNFVEGNTDGIPFVQSITPGDSGSAQGEGTQSAAAEQSEATAVPAQASETPTSGETAAETSDGAAETGDSAAEVAETESVEESDPNVGVKEYNADGQETTEGQSSAPLDAATTGIIVAVIVAVLAIGGAVAYVAYVKPKKAKQAAAAAAAARAAEPTGVATFSTTAKPAGAPSAAAAPDATSATQVMGDANKPSVQ